jgi:hypothetical protein
MLDASRNSRIDFLAMMEPTKLSDEASRITVVTQSVASVDALGILIVGVLLLIAGCGPPI